MPGSLCNGVDTDQPYIYRSRAYCQGFLYRLGGTAAERPKKNNPYGTAGATNYIPWSEELDRWTATNITVTADFAQAPNETNTAERLQYAGSLGLPDTRLVETVQPIEGGTANKVFVGSIYIRSNTGVTYDVRIKLLHDGVDSTFSSNISVPPGWQRISFTKTNTATAGTGNQGFAIAAATTDDPFDVIAWGGQLELDQLTDYIPTYGVPSTRIEGSQVTAGEDWNRGWDACHLQAGNTLTRAVTGCCPGEGQTVAA